MEANAATPRPTPSVPKIPKQFGLKPMALQRAELTRGSFIAIVPNETTFDDVMTPAFWQHHTGMLGLAPGSRPYARIEVIREDGSMDLDLRVLGAKQGMVKVRCLRKYLEGGGKVHQDDAGVIPDMPEGYGLTHVPNGPEKGYLVRLSNGEILAKGIGSRREAVGRAIAHAQEAMAIGPDATIT